MKIKRLLGFSLPMIALAIGGALLVTNSFSKNAARIDAADYSTSGRGLSLNPEGDVVGSFTVSDSSLSDNLGWLLCLFEDKPEYDLDTHKLVNSANLHPYSDVSGCSHYFYAESTLATGNLVVNWAHSFADQKDQWTDHEADGEAGKTLADYLALKDWHIVIGPRHFEEWSGEDIGAGLNNIWENCDYYVGRKNALFNGVDGQTYLDLNNFTDWASGDAKFGFYYYNSTSNGWSEFATPTDFSNIYVAQYSLDFVPTHMIAVRFNSGATELRWNAYEGENYVWNQSSNEDFFKYGVLGITGYSGSSWRYEMASVNVNSDYSSTLDHLKHSGGDSENFNQAVYFNAGDQLTIGFGGNTYYTYKAHVSIADKFEFNSSLNVIEVLENGNYSLYFNTDQHTLYITTIALAQADEWAQSFLGASCVDTKDNWNDLNNSYDDLSSDVQYIFEEEEHVAHNVEVEGYIAKAVQRYDFLVENFEGYYDFMGRQYSQSIHPYESASFTLSESNNSLMAIVAITSISVLSLTSLLVIKKKRLSK